MLTGHQGYLGTVLTPVLTSAGHEVIGLDSGMFADCVLGAAPKDPPGTRTDLRDVTGDSLRDVDAVIHLAALSNDPLGSLAPEITYEINHRASVTLAEHARNAGVRRFLYASTCSVYGAAGDELVTEDAPLRPVTPYADSKVRVEDELMNMADEDFSPIMLRNATAFGFSPRLRADVVVNNLVGHAVLTGEITVLSDGTPWRPLVHAQDIASAFREALTAPKQAVHNRAFNVGTESNNVTVAEIANVVAEVVAGSRVVITGETGADPRSYRVDFSRIRAALPGFIAHRSVRDGAEELCAAYRTCGLDRIGFERRFTRLTRLADRQAAGELGPDLRLPR
jgi:nucleoside-diphosphate-sugar epimerase